MIGVTTVLAALLAALVLSASASAQPLAPYDGSNPFRCQTQNVGQGTNFPDPGADPGLGSC